MRPALLIGHASFGVITIAVSARGSPCIKGPVPPLVVAPAATSYHERQWPGSVKSLQSVRTLQRLPAPEDWLGGVDKSAYLTQGELKLAMSTNTHTTPFVLVKDTVGFAYSCFWPASIQTVIEQANYILPRWTYIMLNWTYNEPKQNYSVFTRWWSKTLQRVQKFSERYRAKIHGAWGDWPLSSIPLLRVETKIPDNTMAVIIRGNNTQNRTWNEMWRLGLVVVPPFLGEREIGDQGLGGEIVTEMLLETRELTSPACCGGLVPIEEEAHFHRRHNKDPFADEEEQRAMWEVYESRRWRKPAGIAEFEAFKQTHQTSDRTHPIHDFMQHCSM